MLESYPKMVVIQDGSKVSLRPVVAEDGERLKEFFARIPEEERWYLRNNVADPRVIDGWMRDLDYERVLPIIAEANGEIVAEASLHRRPFGTLKWTGKVRVVVAAEYRARGLGTWMLLDLVNAAMAAGLEKVMAELVAVKQETAMEALKHLGFIQEAVLTGCARDPLGNPLDMVIMVKSFYPGWSNY